MAANFYLDGPRWPDDFPGCTLGPRKTSTDKDGIMYLTQDILDRNGKKVDELFLAAEERSNG